MYSFTTPANFVEQEQLKLYTKQKMEQAEKYIEKLIEKYTKAEN